MVQIPEKLTEQARPSETEPNQPVSTIKPQERIVLHEPEVVQPAGSSVETTTQPVTQSAPVKPVDVQVPGVPDVSQPPAEITIETPETPVAGSYTDALDDDVVRLAGVESARERETAGSLPSQG